MIEEKKPFVSHLKELRDRLLISIAGVGIAFIITYIFKNAYSPFSCAPSSK